MRNIINTISLIILLIVIGVGFVFLKFDSEKVCIEPYKLVEGNCIYKEYTVAICPENNTFSYSKNRCVNNNNSTRTTVGSCPKGFSVNGLFDGDTSNGTEYCMKEHKEEAKSRLYYLLEKYQ